MSFQMCFNTNSRIAMDMHNVAAIGVNDCREAAGGGFVSVSLGDAERHMPDSHFICCYLPENKAKELYAQLAAIFAPPTPPPPVPPKQEGCKLNVVVHCDCHECEYHG